MYTTHGAVANNFIYIVLVWACAQVRIKSRMPAVFYDHTLHAGSYNIYTLLQNYVGQFP